MHESAVSTLVDWPAPDVEQDSLRHTVLAFLDAAPDACLRKSAPGHLTASTLLLDHTASRVLLTLHPRVGRWIQLGGHCEPSDATIQAAALREAREESGIKDLVMDPVPLALHTHPITCSLGLPTRHLDVRFLAIAPAGSVAVRSDESDDLRWWPVDELPENAERDTVGQLMRLARLRLRT
nr:NUDIX hydrolase [Tomitella biformata]